MEFRSSARGLTSAEAARLRDMGQGNVPPPPITRSTGQIIRENVCTLFHLFNALIAVALALAVTARLGIPYVLFLGEDEIAAGTVTCKDMASGQQMQLPAAETVRRILDGLAEKNRGPVILG